MNARGCTSIFLIIFVMPVLIELALPTISNIFGPKLDDYCKKENLVTIYDVGLFELREQEYEDKDGTVSDGWTTVVTEQHVSKFLYNSIRIRQATLFYNGQKVAETRHYALHRINIITLIGWAPNGGSTACKIAPEYRLKHTIVVEAYGDSRFPPITFQ